MYKFIDQAGKATWVGEGQEIEKPERSGFKELVYSQGKLEYRDSYTGYYRSWGMETVRSDGVPIWTSLYGGGMFFGKQSLASDTFRFLKLALCAEEKSFQSFRGPHHFTDGDWRYAYTQTGNISEFSGEEKIYYRGELVFFHNIIGGRIIHK